MARRVAEVLPAEHLSRHPLDDTISRRAWTNYLDALDPHHVCLLASDVERFRARANTLDDDLKAGDLRFAWEVFDLYRKRLTNRIAYARALLDAGFDLTVDESYSGAGNHFPATAGEWDEAWRKKTKNEVVRYAVERSLDPARAEAAGRVRADLAARLSALHRSDAETVLTPFLTAFAQAYDADSVFVPPSAVAERGTRTNTPPGGTTSWSIEPVTFEGGGARSLGHVRLPAFYGDSASFGRRTGSRPSAARDLSRILAHMRRRSVGGVLLDLRGNPGGCQAETVAVTGLFIGDGPVVMTRKVGERKIQTRRDRDARTAYAGPLVVLVNRLSASASEILAGTLQDYGRAVIVGDSRTYGKGRCQTWHELGRDGRLGALWITTMVDYRVSGVSTQGRGVTPDIRAPSAYEQCLDEGASPGNAHGPPVPGAEFTPVANLSAVISRLREQSEGRREDDPRYRARAVRLATVAELVRQRSVPLHLQKRIELVRACEGELACIRQLLDGERQTPTAGEAPDLVLEEAMAILEDWVEMRCVPDPSEHRDRE